MRPEAHVFGGMVCRDAFGWGDAFAVEMHPYRKDSACRDAFAWSKSSLRKKKSKLGMNPAERNHPCGEKEQTGDESGR